MGLLLLYLSLALVVSFICSILEAVLLSTPLSYLKAKEQKGDTSARIFINLKNKIDRPLSAILSLNTVAHTVGAAGVGAQATIVFGEAYFGIVSAILTLLILILTEIFPKTIGARYWRKLTVISAIAIRIMIVITYPLVLLASFITKIISSNKDEKTISREEISILAHLGVKEGVFDESENKIIQNLILLKKLHVNEIMTPRVVLNTTDESMSLTDFIENKKMVHSRIPVYAGNREHITGYIFRNTVYEKIITGEKDLTLKDIKREILILPNTKPVFGVWQTLLEHKEQIALLVDEYGGVDGIVTMEDIIETLIGFEIVDEKDIIKDMQQFARERWKKLIGETTTNSKQM